MIGAHSNMKYFKAVLLANPKQISYRRVLPFHYGPSIKDGFPHLSVQSPTIFRYLFSSYSYFTAVKPVLLKTKLRRVSVKREPINQSISQQIRQLVRREIEFGDVRYMAFALEVLNRADTDKVVIVL